MRKTQPQVSMSVLSVLLALGHTANSEVANRRYARQYTDDV